MKIIHRFEEKSSSIRKEFMNLNSISSNKEIEKKENGKWKEGKKKSRKKKAWEKM